MKQFIFYILLFICPAWLCAQDGRLVLQSSLHSNITNQNSLSSLIPVYEHNGNILRADSGILHEDAIKRQFFEAFNNVVITQPSGTIIYANRLHYDATAQLATLTGNVRLVSQNSTLTTNYLTYNMRSKTGTYRNGGRIVSQTDTITSKNAYYFENTDDAYFRHNVIVRSQNVKVYTDSMRYNSLSKMTYFFGPTNIKGNNKENLYTEKGTYNTATGIANFNKNNLYTEGSKFFTGDSLHYNRVTGIGEAFRNVVFVDTLDKFYAYGGKGTYRQDEESILMTEKPYIITVVKNDSISNDSTKNQDAITLEPKSKKEIKKEEKAAKDKIKEKEIDQKDSATSNQQLTLPKDSASSKVDSVYMTADTLYSRMILVKNYLPLDLKLNRDGGELIVEDDTDYGDEGDNIDGISDSTSISDFKNIKPDLVSATDSTKSSDLKKINKKDIDTNPVKKKVNTVIPNKNSSDLGSIENTLKADSVLRNQAIVPAANHANTAINQALQIAQKQDSIKTTKDSTVTAVSDTARTRIVKAYYNVRLFKSDFQAVSDSVYYGMQDSMFRFMGRPMIWAQGSQISADTIFMQIINQQIDNALLKENAFMVNAVSDTIKFNQLKGRKITTFFANNNIDRLFVDGNAENLVFAVNEKTKIITEMFHDRGSRIKVLMDGKEIVDYKTFRKVDQKLYPFAQVTQENEILPGFIWRPQDRPKSKEDLLNRKREAAGTGIANSEKTSLPDEKNNLEELEKKIKSKSKEINEEVESILNPKEKSKRIAP